MPFKLPITSTIITAVGTAVCAVVATLDQHPKGGAYLIALVLAVAIAMAIVAIASKWKGNGDTVSPAPVPKKPPRRKAS